MGNLIQYLLLKQGEQVFFKCSYTVALWDRREVRKKGGKVSLKSREWVMAKKDRRRRQGKGYEYMWC